MKTRWLAHECPQHPLPCTLIPETEVVGFTNIVSILTVKWLMGLRANPVILILAACLELRRGGPKQTERVLVYVIIIWVIL